MAIPAVYVLPSNEIPAESSFALESITSNRALRERCINSYGNLYRNTTRYPKYEATNSPTENIYEPTTAFTRATGHDPSLAAGILLGGLQIWDNEAEYRYLQRHLRQCEAYQKYRSGGGKEQKSSDAQKWPPHYEEVFWRALLYYEPMQRRKMTPRGRGNRPLPENKRHQLGRNELIALFIMDWFNIPFDSDIMGHEPRKKVSSHIQVNKNFFKEDEWVLYLLGQRGVKRPHGVGIPVHLSTKANMVRCMANGSAPQRMQTRQSLLPQAPYVLPSQGNMHPTTLLQPHEFHMYIQHPQCRRVAPNHDCRHAESRCEFDTIHTITKSQKGCKLPPRPLDEVEDWQRIFPQLEQMQYEDGLDCVILYAESSLRLAVDPLPANCKMSIENSFRLSPSMMRLKPSVWQCRTRVFENGRVLENETVDDCQTIDETNKQVGPDQEDKCLIHVLFRSGYWATKFHNLALILRAAIEEVAKEEGLSGEGNARTLLRRAEEEVRSHIKNVTVVQEIFIADPTYGSRKRVLLIYWKFRQTHREEIGITTWRNLLPPQMERKASTILELDVAGMNTMRPTFDFSTGLMMGNEANIQTHPMLGMSSQQELDILSSAALFDPSSYDFCVDEAEPGDGLDEQSMDMTNHTMAGAEMHHSLSYADSLAFDMIMTQAIDPTITAVTIEDPMHAYDPSLMGGSADATPVQLLVHNSQPESQDYDLTRSTQEYEPVVPNQGHNLYTHHDNFAEQPHFDVQRQYQQQKQQELQQQHYNEAQYASFDALFGDTVVGAWPQHHQRQQPHSDLQLHQPELHLQQPELLLQQPELHLQQPELQLQQPPNSCSHQQPNFRTIPYETHFALQEAQKLHDHSTSVTRAVEDWGCIAAAAAKGEVEDWEIVMLGEMEAAGRSNVVGAGGLVVPSLLPSVLEG